MGKKRIYSNFSMLTRSFEIIAWETLFKFFLRTKIYSSSAKERMAFKGSSFGKGLLNVTFEKISSMENLFQIIYLGWIFQHILWTEYFPNFWERHFWEHFSILRKRTKIILSNRNKGSSILHPKKSDCLENEFLLNEAILEKNKLESKIF